MADKKAGDKRSLSGKSRVCLEAYRHHGQGMRTKEFFERFPEFSINSHYYWRSAISGYAEAWDLAEARNILGEDASEGTGGFGDLLDRGFAVWLEAYERTGNRKDACVEACLTVDDIEDELKSNELFLKRFRELEKLWDWEVEDGLRNRARDGVVSAQKAWLESKVPAFGKRLNVDVNQRFTLELSDVGAATKKFIAERGEHSSRTLESGDIIDVESEVVDGD